MKPLLAAIAISLLALAARAAPAWTVDPAASAIRFESSFGGTAFTGAFSRWTATIRFDPADLAHSSASASIDLASAATGDADRDSALPDAPFFDVARFPRAVFQAGRFRSLGGGRYVAEGTLSLRGVTRPVSLPFTLAITGGTARMTAETSLDRLAFGVGQGRWADTSVLPAPVRVDISLIAHRR